MNNTIYCSSSPIQYHWCFVRKASLPPHLEMAVRQALLQVQSLGGCIFCIPSFDNLLKNAWRAVQFRLFFGGESTKYCFQNSKFELFLCEIDWRSGASSIQGTWPCWGNGGADVAGETAVRRTTPSTRLGNQKCFWDKSQCNLCCPFSNSFSFKLEFPDLDDAKFWADISSAGWQSWNKLDSQNWRCVMGRKPGSSGDQRFSSKDPTKDWGIFGIFNKLKGRNFGTYRPWNPPFSMGFSQSWGHGTFHPP